MPARSMERIAAERISVLPGPPTLYQTLLNDPRRSEYDLSSLRLGVTGAAVVPVELVKAMGDELGFTTVLTAYGLTESCGTVTMCRRTDPPEIVANTSGRAIPGLEVRAVVDGRPVPTGEPGEIVVRGYTVMSGYWGNEEATAEAIDDEGWLHTGDIGGHGRGGQRHHHRPAQGHVRRGRFQRLSRRDRGPPAHPRGRGGGRRRRRPRRAHGRGRMCLRGAGAARAPTPTSWDDPFSVGPGAPWPTTKSHAASSWSMPFPSMRAGRCSSGSSVIVMRPVSTVW